MGKYAEAPKYISFLKTICSLTLIAGLLTGCQASLNQTLNTDGGNHSQDTRTAVAALPGKFAPSFSLPSFSSSKVVSLTNLLGRKPILINVFATWCPPCQKEAPLLEQGYRQLAGKVIFIAVNATSEEQNSQAPIDFIQKNQISFPVLKDPKGAFLDQYAIIGLPTTFLVNPDGKIVKAKVGSFKSLAELVRFAQSPGETGSGID